MHVMDLAGLKGELLSTACLAQSTVSQLIAILNIKAAK